MQSYSTAQLIPLVPKLYISEISVLSYRGSRLAEFLTDGDATGDVKKSAKELQEYDPNAVELCRKLATHYSKQLFEIYKNKEDALFLSS